jgi:hypothetical protein
MNKAKATRLTLQTVALAFGLLGLYYIYLGLDSTVRGPWKPESDIGFFLDGILFLGMNSIFILGGGAVVAIAWKNLRHFGARSVRNLSGLLAFAAWIGMSVFLLPVETAAREARTGFRHFVISLSPILLAFLLHRVLSKKLVAMAGTTSAGQDSLQATDGPHFPPETPKHQ